MDLLEFAEDTQRMKKKATKQKAKGSDRQSTLNFPTASEADVIAEAAAAVTSTKSAIKTPAYETGAELLARILTERRQNWQGRGKYKELAEPETSKLSELPAGWTWATVEQVAAPEPNSITDGPFGSNLKTEHYMDSVPGHPTAKHR